MDSCVWQLERQPICWTEHRVTEAVEEIETRLGVRLATEYHCICNTNSFNGFIHCMPLSSPLNRLPQCYAFV